MAYLSPRTKCVISGCGFRRSENGVCGAHLRKLIESSWDIEGIGFWMLDGEIGYESVHGRLRALRGTAREHECAECGRQASDYSYDHEDPDELIGMTERLAIAKYSLDLGHYQALCRSCHRKRDIAAA
ncbi:hypothetical protein [Mycobacteroides abscessus]|uniref:hypothetical protein n=1 Tax=Mycobacteroides abscessus TaxID=36809 RepID=UPI000A33B58E|nr:hypothetical protein [Mycobacteroides abscessus]OTR21927.1 hypothetical protein B9M80_15985 [Mycobacteroides abscessus]